MRCLRRDAADILGAEQLQQTLGQLLEADNLTACRLPLRRFVIAEIDEQSGAVLRDEQIAFAVEKAGEVADVHLIRQQHALLRAA